MGTGLVRPPFTYYGGKTRIAETIVSYVPRDHAHYVEPFAGSLAVLLAKPATRMETINDIDGRLTNFWRVLRDQGHALANACELTPHSRTEYENANHISADPVEDARRVWVLLTQSRTGTMSNTGWRHYLDGNASSTSMPRYLNGYRQRLPEAARRIRDVSIEDRPALDIIATYGNRESTLIYCDPPYLGSTRTRNYAHEMTTELDHRRLAEELNACNADVVLSGYDSPLYRDLYRDWHRVDIAATTTQGKGTNRRIETLWSNVPLLNQQPLAGLEIEI